MLRSVIDAKTWLFDVFLKTANDDEIYFSENRFVNVNTKPFFEKPILPLFAVLKNTSNSQGSASITLLNMVFQITPSSTDPDFAYTSIISR